MNTVPNYTNCVKKVKPGKFGTAEIVHDTPSPIDRLRAFVHRQPPLLRTTYCRLIVQEPGSYFKDIMMTDAEFERRTNIEIICAAKGNALVAGLGIGLILDPMVKKCKSVTVIEKNEDVIKLVASSFPKVKVIHANIFEWLPEKGTKYDTIYFDIWPGICRDDLDQAKLLHKRFRPFLAREGYMRSWTQIANLYNR